MKNVLLCVCRATHRYSEKQIADKLNVTTDEYIEMETSAIAMMPEQAEALSRLFNIEAEYFLESSRQLELLLAREQVILYLQAEIERLKKFVVVTKGLLLDGNKENATEENDKNVDHEQETLHQ